MGRTWEGLVREERPKPRERLGSRQEGPGCICMGIYGAVGCGNRYAMFLPPWGLNRETLASLGWETVGGRASNHPGWTRFSAGRIATDGNSIPGLRSHILASNIQSTYY